MPIYLFSVTEEPYIKGKKSNSSCNRTPKCYSKLYEMTFIYFEYLRKWIKRISIDLQLVKIKMFKSHKNQKLLGIKNISNFLFKLSISIDELDYTKLDSKVVQLSNKISLVK